VAVQGRLSRARQEGVFFTQQGGPRVRILNGRYVMESITIRVGTTLNQLQPATP
jgi:hypothetical protein